MTPRRKDSPERVAVYGRLLYAQGDYLWRADAGLGPDGFRPLRGMAAELPAAKVV
jgi:hypothetical protein